MWDWLLLISLLLTGMALIVIEILFVPGTTVVGLFGFAFAVTGVFASYRFFGAFIGNCVLSASAILFTLVIYFAFKSDIWLKMAHKKVNQTKVNEGLLDGLEIAMKGKALSDFRPIGKAQFGDQIYEATSLANDLIRSGEMITIVKLKDSRIFIQRITNE